MKSFELGEKTKGEGRGTAASPQPPGRPPPGETGPPWGETRGKGPPAFLEVFNRASKKLEMAREVELLDFMGKDAEKGKEVRIQWYNYTRGLGANREEAHWDNRNRYPP